jgi:DNA-binding IscR family transcriptional regulator
MPANLDAIARAAAVEPALAAQAIAGLVQRGLVTTVPGSLEIDDLARLRGALAGR